MSPPGPEAQRVERLVLDTSAYSHLRRGHEGVLESVASATVVGMPLIVLGELEAAYELGSRHRENRLLLEEFLDEPWVVTLPVTRATTRHYARVFEKLRRAGTPIPINDVWIAASTLEANGHLLTFDHDFDIVADLDVTVLGRR